MSIQIFTPDTISSIKIPTTDQIYIIPSIDQLDKDICYSLIDILPRPPIFLPPSQVACKIKCSQSGFFICLTEMCDKHPLNGAILKDKRYKVVETDSNVKLINSRNKNIIKYYQMKYDNINMEYIDNDKCLCCYENNSGQIGDKLSNKPANLKTSDCTQQKYFEDNKALCYNIEISPEGKPLLNSNTNNEFKKYGLIEPENIQDSLNLENLQLSRNRTYCEENKGEQYLRVPKHSGDSLLKVLSKGVESNVNFSHVERPIELQPNETKLRKEDRENSQGISHSIYPQLTELSIGENPKEHTQEMERLKDIEQQEHVSSTKYNNYSRESKHSNDTFLQIQSAEVPFDRVKFLIARLSKTETVKNCNIFGIYFTNNFYYNQAKYLKKLLKDRGKKAFLFCLADISYERLTCVDGIECTVILDCEYSDHFHIPLSMPLIVPFELYVAFGDWQGEYDKNVCPLKNDQLDFDVKTTNLIPIEYCTGDLIKRNEIQAVSFHVEDENDDMIYDGYSGIAGDYEK